MLKIKNDPFTIMFKAFSQLWPAHPCEIEFSNDIPKPTIDDLDDRDLKIIAKDKIAEIGAAGATRFKAGAIPLIRLSPNLSFEQTVSTLAEELIHVAVGPEAGHGVIFEKALKKLFIKFGELTDEIYGS